jgi:monoamine oxidase
MIRFPWTARSRPLSPAECPKRIRDLRFQQRECREKLKKIGRVAVVGGGFAGLMAARRLVQHGVKVTLFEARKEVGGRVLSIRNFSAGRITEEGAELIGSFHTTWLELAREFGLAMISRMDPDLYERECLDVRLKLEKDKFLSMKDFWKLTEAMNNRVLMPLAELAKKEIDDPSRPWLQPNLQTYDNMSAAQAFENIYKVPRNTLLWKMLQFKLENDEVAPLDEMNFLGLLCKVRAGQGKRCVEDDDIRPSSSCILDGYWEELEIFRCADGCQTLAKKMAVQIQTPKKKSDPKPAEVRRLLAVRRINLSRKGAVLSVKATREDGRFVDDKPPELIPGVFSYVILAIPPSVWPGVKITADGKDADPAKEIGPMRMNDAVKYFSDVKERFWIKEKPDPNRDRGSAPYGGSLQIGQVWEGTDNQTRVDEKQGIVLSVFAGPIRTGPRGPRAPTRDEFKQDLPKLYRGYTRNLNNTRFANWPNLPFIMTGYWAPYPKEIFKVGKKLTDPYPDRLFFAGEHTQIDFFGYMEGALRSGERAAETLMLHACDLLEKPVEKPAPKSSSPPIVARATPVRGNTAFQREVGTRLEEHSSTDYPEEAESPFLDRNLFAGAAEEEWEPRAAVLVAESPFVSALEELESGFDWGQRQEEEAPTGLDGGDEQAASETWDYLEEDQVPQTDQAEDESLVHENASLHEGETKLESPEGFVAAESPPEGFHEYSSDELSLAREQEWEHSELEESIVDPFPRRIVMPLQMVTVKNDTFGDCIKAASQPADVRALCGAVVDLTGDPDLPPYRGHNDTDMLYVGSLAKIYPLLAAFELRRRVTWQAKDMIKIGLSTTTAGWQNKVFAELKKGWQPRLDAAFRGRGLPSKFPKLVEVIELSPDGTAQLREEFLDWIRAALHHNDEAAVGRYIRALSYPYINGVLAAAGFFDPAKKKGLWMSGDYNGNDWLRDDAAGMPLTARWRLPGHAVSNFTGTALQVVRFLGLMAQGKLVDKDSSGKMIELLGRPFLWDTLATPHRPFTSVDGKVGIGTWDSRYHDGAIVKVERGGDPARTISYVLAVLGSPKTNDISALRKLELAYHDCVVARHS